MKSQKIIIENIPAILWGEESDRIWLHVHGKLSRKEYAAEFAEIAQEKGWQVLSFDLPGHGERASQQERCDIWNGMRDLRLAADFVFDRWKKVNLYGCSLGACFSLNAFPDRAFGKCLFQSPVVDMEYLIGMMMRWFGITEARLEAEGEIETPVDILSWPYLQYVRSHPIAKWDFPTSILYAGKDNLQSREVIDRFCARFGCGLTVSEDSEHPFMAPGDAPIVEKWLRENI